jgi:hypothetical protein
MEGAAASISEADLVRTADAAVEVFVRAYDLTSPTG